MIHGVAETGGVEPRVTNRTGTAKPTGGGGFAAELDRETKKDAKKAPAAKPAQVPERTTPVAGHGYSEIVAGPRNGMFLNTSGNERDGQAFLVVERAGRTFHVYGTGDSRAVFEVKPEQAPKASAPKAPAATTPAATSPAATTPGTPAVAAPATPPIASIPGVNLPAGLAKPVGPAALPSIR